MQLKRLVSTDCHEGANLSFVNHPKNAMPASAIIYHALFKHQDTSHGLEAGFQGPHPLCTMESNPPPPAIPPLLSWNPIGKGVISLGYP